MDVFSLILFLWNNQRPSRTLPSHQHAHPSVASERCNVLARFEELSEAVAAQYAQNLHDKVEQVGNHPVGPNYDSARPSTCYPTGNERAI